MPVPSTVADLSSTASSNYPSGSESIGTSLDDYLRAHASIIKQVSDAKADTSHTQAASTISDSTAAGRTLLTAADASAQRTALGLGTAATATLGTGSGQVPTADQVSGLVQLNGQCRLVKSGANLVLQPFNGNKIVINGAVQTIPSAGVSLAAPATSGTTYFIYAYMNVSTMTLEASATGHATDSTTGVEIKSGDATRTLVGMARTVSSAWVDTESQRFVISWFNRQQKTCFKQAGSTYSTSSASFVELNSAFRAEFLSWGDGVTLGIAGGVSVGTGGSWQLVTAMGLDGSGTIYMPCMPSTVSTDGTTNSIGGTATASPTEGYHYVNVLAQTSGSTFYLYSSTDITATFLG